MKTTVFNIKNITQTVSCEHLSVVGDLHFIWFVKFCFDLNII